MWTNGRCAGTMAVLLAAVLVLAGCEAAPPAARGEATPASPSDAIAASAGPGASAEPGPSLPVDLPEEIAHAIRQRQAFGLRSDLAWVQQVAVDPRASVNLLDFPMLPEEEAEFEARQASFEELAAAVNAYAATRQDSFGGVWIDQGAHTVVAAWTSSPELHRLAILASVGKPAPLEGRLVRYSERELSALQDRLAADREWLRTIPATMTFSSVDVMANRTELGISSANAQAAALILAHYGVGADMLSVVSDGTGILLEPRGTVNGTVVLVDGSAPGQNDWALAWVPDRPQGGGDCGEMVGYGVSPDGLFTIDCAPGGWTFRVQAPAGDGWRDIGSGHVVVRSEQASDVRVVVDPGASASP
ncbi:MAG TPA: hypothetical protein VFQ75_10040 [Candidatus Limnocylindrales bacterium]|nr:hypothetical protein [Candidatus Limnocylindrales bacterium]